VQGGFAAMLKRFIEGPFKRFADMAVRHRYATCSAFLGLFIVTIALLQSGWVKFVFFPAVQADFIIATLVMPDGTPASVTEAAVRRMEAAASEVELEIDGRATTSEEGNFQHFLSTVGAQPVSGVARGPGPPSTNQGSGGHVAEVVIELAPPERRTHETSEIADRWRKLTGSIPGAVELAFASDLVSTGEAINLQLTGPDFLELRAAADELKAVIAGYGGTRDITDTFRDGKEELVIKLKPGAESLGLSTAEIGRQVRQAFFGEEAQRFLRRKEEVKVMVRYPREEREALQDVSNMRVRLPDGGEVPFNEVAEAELGRGYSKITRVDRRRAVNVIADVDAAQANPSEILADITAKHLPGILARHPRVVCTQEGESREQQDAIGGLAAGASLSLFLIYALLAIPFRSYVQPLIVMSIIPFSLTGAVAGHMIMDMPLSILSVCGIVALAGVVVNDSLVLVDYVNRRRREGATVFEAVGEAPVSRFRAVLLTSLTTFAGLTPLLLEKSAQAQFLIPMAVSLAFGVMYATLITLVLVPSVYLMLEDAGWLWKKIRSGLTAKSP